MEEEDLTTDQTTALVAEITVAIREDKITTTQSKFNYYSIN